MNWKNWKVGMWVSILSGVFTGMLCIAVSMNWKQIMFIMLLNIGKDGLLFIRTHPTDTISFDTHSVKKTDVDGSSVETTQRTTVVPTPVIVPEIKEKVEPK